MRQLLLVLLGRPTAFVNYYNSDVAPLYLVGSVRVNGEREAAAASSSSSVATPGGGSTAPPALGEGGVPGDEEEMATATWQCGLCLAEGPPSMFERYFEGSGAGDICGRGTSGHVFCPDCARDCKEIANYGRHPDSLAKCPTCTQTVAKNRPDHECLVCRNEGGPQEGRPPFSEAADDVPDAVRVGCWGCGRTAVDPVAMTIDRMERGELMAWNEVPAAMKNNAKVIEYPGGTCSIAFLIIRKAMEQVPLGFRFTQADFAGLSMENRENEDTVVDAIRFGVLTSWNDHVPSVLRGQWKVVLEAIDTPTLRFTINDWRSLDDELQKYPILVEQAIRKGVLTDFWRDVPEELREKSLIAEAAVEAGLFTNWSEIPEALRRSVNLALCAIEWGTMTFTLDDWRGLDATVKGNAYVVGAAIKKGLLKEWGRDVPEALRSLGVVAMAIELSGPGSGFAFTLNDWRGLRDGLKKSPSLVQKAIRKRVLTDWKDVPEVLWRNQMILDTWRTTFGIQSA